VPLLHAGSGSRGYRHEAGKVIRPFAFGGTDGIAAMSVGVRRLWNLHARRI